MEPQSSTSPVRLWLLIVLAVVVLGVAGYFGWSWWNKFQTAAPVIPINAPSITSAITAEPETTTTPEASKSTISPTASSTVSVPTVTTTSVWKTPTDGTFSIKLDANTTKTVSYKIPQDWFFVKTDTFYPFGPLIITNKKTCVDTYSNYFTPPAGCEIIAISPALPGDSSSQNGGIDSYNSVEGQSIKSSNGDLVIRSFASPIKTGAFPNVAAVIGIDSPDSTYKYQETIDFSIPKGSDNSAVISTIKQIVATMTLK